MVPHNSHRLSSHFFHSSFFFLLWQDNFQWCVFKFTDSFFCLIKSAVDTIYCICFLSCILSSAPEFVWFFLFLFLYWTSHFIHILFFMTLFSCLHVFSWRSPTFLKKLFWIIQQFKDLQFFSHLLENYCLFGGVMFPCFLVFLVALCW